MVLSSRDPTKTIRKALKKIINTQLQQRDSQQTGDFKEFLVDEQWAEEQRQRREHRGTYYTSRRLEQAGREGNPLGSRTWDARQFINIC